MALEEAAAGEDRRRAKAGALLAALAKEHPEVTQSMVAPEIRAKRPRTAPGPSV